MNEQVLLEQPARRSPVIKPVLARATLLTVDLLRLAGFVSEGLGLASKRIGEDILMIYDRRTGFGGSRYWVLEARQVGSIAVPQSMLNHWGLTVGSAAEVDEAFERTSQLEAKFGLKPLQKPRNQHGSYSFYIADADSNWWEIEYREPGATYPDLMAAEGKDAEAAR